MDMPRDESLGTTEVADGAEETAAIRLSSRQHPDHDTDHWPDPTAE